jgi:hypothetical protein
LGSDGDVVDIDWNDCRRVDTMSKQDFIEVTIDNVGKYESLQMHLSSNFYPPLPKEVKVIFGDAFNMYWAGMIDMFGLQKELSRVYKGSLFSYGFDNYLNEEDLGDEY